MSTADQLLELMFSWMEKRERCALQLKKLAAELELLAKKCRFGEAYGSSVSVVGAACLIGAGAATLFTGGAAAPLLGVVGATCTGFGVTVSVVSKITEYFSSSSTMKEAQDVEQESNQIGERLQQLFKQLKAESGSSCPDELDQYVLTELLGAMARWSGLTWKFNIRMFGDEPRFYIDQGLGHRRFETDKCITVTAGFAGILRFFTFEVSGVKFKFLFAQGSKQLIKGLTSKAFKTAVKGSAMVVGGAVGLAFALPEAIDGWTELIKNDNVSEASRSLRDTAEDILKIIRTLRQQLENVKRTFDEAAKMQQEKVEEQKTIRNQGVGIKPWKLWCSAALVLALVILVLVIYFSGSSPAQTTIENQGVGTPDSQSNIGEQGYGQGEQKKQGSKETAGGQQGGGDDGDKNNGGKDDQRGDKERDNEKESEDKEDEQTKQTEGSPAEISVGLLNVRSINNKPSRISELITRSGRSVFLTTETWARENTADSVLTQASPENFGFNQWVRPSRGGGVATQFLRSLGGERVHFTSVTSFEYVATVLQQPNWNQPILSINLYLPPGYNQERFRTFLNEFQQLLDEASQTYDSLLVTGDFNIRYDPERRSYTDEFFFLLGINNLDQHVQEATHQRGNMLDLVITRNVHVSRLTVQDDGISDHYTINFNARPTSTGTGKDTKEEKEEDERVKRVKKSEE